MMLTCFRSRLHPELKQACAVRALRHTGLAAQMPGDISYQGDVAAAIERLTVVDFKTRAQQPSWAMRKVGA